MAMNIQKGKVGYKGVDNISCFFATVGENTYYFIDPNGIKIYYDTDNVSIDQFKLSNGNFVVTSVLSEAVDPQIVASHIGVINPEGEVVIPLENKKIVRVEGVA